MELFHLRTFVTVAEEGHLTRASERLFTSQPAISAQLKALEEELGVTLFDRTPKGMQLTAAGERLLDDARRALAAAGDLLHNARSMHDRLIGKVRIGLNTDANFLRLVEIQSTLRSRHPELELEFLSGTTAGNVPQLRIDRLDGSFLSGDAIDPSFEGFVLCHEELAIAVPATMRDAVGTGDIATLARLPWVHTSVDCAYYQAMQKLFSQHCCEPAKTLIVNQDDGIASMIQAGIGLGILRREKVEAMAAGGKVFALDLPLPALPLSFAVRAKRAQEPLLRAVIAAVADVWGIHRSDEETATDRRVAV